MNQAEFAEHERIVDELFRLLGTGGFQPGDCFPTAETLARRWQVPEQPVRVALEELVDRGRLFPQGQSMLVAPERIRRDTRRMNSISEAMARRGMKTASRVVRQDICEAAKELASALKIPLGARVFRLVRLRMINGETLLLEYSYLPAEQFPGVENHDYGAESLYHVLKSCYGISPMQQDLEYELGYPGEEERELMGLPPGTLLLTQLGHTRDQNGHSMEYSVSKSVANRFVYESVAQLGGSSFVQAAQPQGQGQGQGQGETGECI